MFQSAYINPDAASAEWTYRAERLTTRRSGRRTAPGERRFSRSRRAG
jgi:hypothetical protein